MKASDNFKTVIQSYLEHRAISDELFAVVYGKENKNIDDCIQYILNEVQRSGCNGFMDDEIFGMAVHYYDEDNIEIGKSIDCRVVMNHIVELTDEEKAQAHRDALQKAQNEAYTKLKQSKSKPKAIAHTDNRQQSLFDL